MKRMQEVEFCFNGSFFLGPMLHKLLTETCETESPNYIYLFLCVAYSNYILFYIKFANLLICWFISVFKGIDLITDN